LKLIVIQSAYDYRALCERKLLNFATSKDLGEFFDQVLTVHPASTLELYQNSKERYGRFTTIHHSSRHVFIEGKAGRFWFLRKHEKLNFLLSQMELFYQLFKMIRRNKDFFVRAEDPRYNGILGYLLTRMSSIPFIVGSWGNPDTIRKNSQQPLQPKIFKTTYIEQLCEKFLIRRADCVLVQNEDNFNYARAYGAKEDRIKYFRLGNAIYPGHFVDPNHRGHELELQLNGFKICTVSRLEKLKLVDHAIRSFANMKHSNEAQLYIFGDGSERESLITLSHQLGVAHRVHFLGNIDQDKLSKILVRMNLVLSPLMGRALTEVALAGLPIVAYNIDCHPELIKSYETGILVDYLDESAMSLAADHLFENAELAREMGLAARIVALELMDPDKLVQEQRSIFEEFFKKYKYGKNP
jgi:glycosyltransferase involved in cell wall biosynthesis